jgi:hypothetical protein
VAGGEGVGARNAASLEAENSDTMLGGISAPDKTESVRVLRVDEDKFPRILIDKDGNVEIPVIRTKQGKGPERDLFINVEQPQRAETFLKRRIKQGKPASIKSVEVEKSFIDQLRRDAVLEEDLVDFPGSPVKVDLPTPDQFGLKTSEQIEAFRRTVIQGSGKVK